MSRNALIRKNEEVISVQADNKVNVDVYVESLYKIKRQNMESKVFVKYLNIEFEVLKDDTIESLRNKLFFNLYNSLERISQQHPHVLNMVEKNNPKSKNTSNSHRNSDRMLFSEVNGDFKNLIRYFTELFKSFFNK